MPMSSEVLKDLLVPIISYWFNEGYVVEKEENGSLYFEVEGDAKLCSNSEDTLQEICVSVGYSGVEIASSVAGTGDKNKVTIFVGLSK